jgi:hypothetical protein
MVQFLRELFCKRHDYEQAKGWYVSGKGGRETTICYGIRKTCSKCGRTNFLAIGKIYQFFSERQEAYAKLESIIKESYITESQIRNLVNSTRQEKISVKAT